MGSALQVVTTDSTFFELHFSHNYNHHHHCRHRHRHYDHHCHYHHRRHFVILKAHLTRSVSEFNCKSDWLLPILIRRPTPFRYSNAADTKLYFHKNTHLVRGF
jgi:hypothetical protein